MYTWFMRSGGKKKLRRKPHAAHDSYSQSEIHVPPISLRDSVGMLPFRATVIGKASSVRPSERQGRPEGNLANVQAA